MHIYIYVCMHVYIHLCMYSHFSFEPSIFSAHFLLCYSTIVREDDVPANLKEGMEDARSKLLEALSMVRIEP